MKIIFKNKISFYTWLLTPVLWIFSVAAINIEEISFWAGYNYALISQYESLERSINEKRKMRAIVGACLAAEKTTCTKQQSNFKKNSENIFSEMNEQRNACIDLPDFLIALRNEAQKRNISEAEKINSPEACRNLSEIAPPELSLITIALVASTPFITLLLHFFLGRFRRAPERTSNKN